MPHLPGIKVYCATPKLNVSVQRVLSDTIGCRWGKGFRVGWNAWARYLVVQKGPFGWFLSRATEAEWESIPLQLWQAEDLIRAYQQFLTDGIGAAGDPQPLAAPPAPRIAPTPHKTASLIDHLANSRNVTDGQAVAGATAPITPWLLAKEAGAKALSILQGLKAASIDATLNQALDLGQIGAALAAAGGAAQAVLGTNADTRADPTPATCTAKRSGT